MKISVYMLSEEGCLDCKAAIASLKNASLKSGVEFHLYVYDFSEDKAINLAIEHNLDSVPSFVIGKTAMNGPSFKEADLILALKKAQDDNRQVS